MDRELIIRLAREAGLWEMLEGYANEYVCGNAEEDCLPDLERFAALVAAHERKQALAGPESDYERGFVDGMQEQMKRSVDKAVNRMAQTTHWEGAPTPRKPLTDDEIAQAMFRADAIVTGPMQFRFAREIERAHGIRSRDV